MYVCPYLISTFSRFFGILAFSLSAKLTNAVHKTSLLRQTAEKLGWSMIHSMKRNISHLSYIHDNQL